MGQNGWKRHLGLAVKLAIAVLSVAFLYRELRLKDDSSDLIASVRFLLERPRLDELAWLLALMAVNWGLEARKWQVLMGTIEHLSLFRSFKAVLSGVTVAMFTPNRVGEYGGRVFHLEKADRIDAVLLTVVGSYAQLTVTIVTGIAAAYAYLPDYLGLGPLTLLQYRMAGIGLLALCILLVALLLNARLLTAVLRKLNLPKAARRHAEVFKLHSPRSLMRVLLASAGRYAIFTYQFFLLLRIFSVEIGYWDAMMMISLTYFVMTGIPTIAFSEVVTRGSVAVYFISELSDNVSGIVAASSVLWLINLALPALFGVVTLFEMRFFRKEEG